MSSSRSEVRVAGRIPRIVFLLCAILSLTDARRSVRAADCNDNGVEDSEETTGGISADCNANGIPDECDTLPSSILFLDSPDPSSGDSPEVRSADVDLDGRADLVSVDTHGSGLSVLLGNGDGSFDPAAMVSPGTRMSSLALSDFNGDFRIDIVAANQDSILFHAGKGDGSFELPQRFTTGGVQRLTVSDFDSNGDLDLLLVMGSRRKLSLMRGFGDGAFEAPVDILGEEPPLGLLQVCDVNGDGKLDVVMTDLDSSEVEVFLGSGDGTVEAPVAYATAAPPGNDGPFPSPRRMTTGMAIWTS